jgi:hypothetical protein
VQLFVFRSTFHSSYSSGICEDIHGCGHQFLSYNSWKVLCCYSNATDSIMPTKASNNEPLINLQNNNSQKNVDIYNSQPTHNSALENSYCVFWTVSFLQTKKKKELFKEENFL